MKNALAAVVLAVLAGCGGSTTGPSFKTTANTVFTTGLNDRGLPVNSVEAVSLDQDRFYVFTAWNQIAPGEHRYMARVLDAEERAVLSDSQKLSPTNVSAATVSEFQLNRYVQKPGAWTVEVYLDNERLAERKLKVLAATN